MPLFLISSSTTTLFENQIVEEHHFQIIEKEFEIKTAIDGFTSTTLLIRDLPPIQGILRSQETGIDPFDGSTLREWKERLETIFSRIVEINPQIDNVRYIGVDGTELVRVNNNQGRPRVVPELELQNKAHRTYFQEGIQTGIDEIYVSEVELNMEHGVIETPHKPVLRIATPVFNDQGVQGVIVVNTQLTEIFNFIALTPLGEVIMTNEEGDFIIHADEEKRFSSQLNTDFNFLSEHPELKDHLHLDFEDHYDQEKREFLIWRKVKYNPSDENQYWLLFSVIDQQELFSPIKKLLARSLFIAFISIIIASILILFIVSKILKPLESLTAIINEISQGNTDVTIDSSLKNTPNEIGKMAQAFDRTIVSLKLAMHQTAESEQEEEKPEENKEKNNEP